ncbi:hypothetical protein A3A56_03880 [Candidatus Roizmanbacteria bacterium RIFCSPLOWO2_01_FULL_40_32]|nr:MAG: hypothetical protein A3A56_03880 [Candidatus Roizmanbacteria bacterium RIFCSPLOWO2_01_FULL_40_32]
MSIREEVNMARKQMANKITKESKDDQVVIEITRGYIQDFVEANYERKLTESELKELSWLVWNEGDYDLMCWIGAAVDQILTPDKNEDK